MKRFQDETLAYALLRLTLGMNIFGHGFIRIVGGVSVFVAAQLTGFENSPLPIWFVQAFLTIMPFAELTIGLRVRCSRNNRFAALLRWRNARQPAGTASNVRV